MGRSRRKISTVDGAERVPAGATPRRGPKGWQGALITVGAGALIVIAAITIRIATMPGGSTGTPLDAGLKHTANRVSAVLRAAQKPLPVQDTTLRSFEAWYYDSKLASSRAAKLRAPGQFLQSVYIDDNTFPPQAQPLFAGEHAPINVTAAVVHAVVMTHRAQYTTITQAGIQYRAYVTTVTPPAALTGASVTALLEVIQPMPKS